MWTAAADEVPEQNATAAAPVTCPYEVSTSVPRQVSTGEMIDPAFTTNGWTPARAVGSPETSVAARCCSVRATARSPREPRRALVLEAKQRQPSLNVEVYEANRGARAFYAKVRFAETGRPDVDDQDRPLPLVEMRLRGYGVDISGEVTQRDGRAPRSPVLRLLKLAPVSIGHLGIAVEA